MDIIESYLSEVGRFLPESRRDELITELRDDLLGELEALVEERGGQLTDADQRSVIGGFGHPFKVAARYQPTKYLIGPGLYPVFVQTLKTVFVLAVVLWVAVTVIGYMVTGEPLGPLQLLGRLIELGIWVVAVVILVFLAIEYSGEKLRWYEDWDPQTLSTGSLNVIRRGDVITNLITEGVFLLWWNDVLSFSHWMSDDAAIQLSLSAAWSAFFWPLNIAFGVAFALHVYVLMRGVWQRPALLTEVVVNVALLGIAFALLVNGPLLEIEAMPAETLYGVAQNSARAALLVISGFAIWDVWVAVRGFRGIQLLAR